MLVSWNLCKADSISESAFYYLKMEGGGCYKMLQIQAIP